MDNWVASVLCYYGLNYSAVNVQVKFFVWTEFYFFLGKNLELILLAYMINVNLTLKEIAKMFSKYGCIILHFYQQYMSAPYFLHSPIPTLNIISLLNFSQSSECVVVFSLGFEVLFP